VRSLYDSAQRSPAQPYSSHSAGTSRATRGRVEEKH
jgi:hypothetical protein